MTKQEIEVYFERLSEILSTHGVVGEIALFGGAAMVLAYKARVSTKDVDAIFEPKDVVYKAAAEVSRECGAAEGWLNDAVKGFVSEKRSMLPLLELPNLRVTWRLPISAGDKCMVCDWVRTNRYPRHPVLNETS